MEQTRFVIIGGGPAGHHAATTAARYGAQVTVIERDVVGGAANLWDCVPSKTMIATGGAMLFARRSSGMGLAQEEVEVDIAALAERINKVKAQLEANHEQLLISQGVRVIRGTGKLLGPNSVEATTPDGVEVIHADVVLLATGSRPRVPEWATPDGIRVLTTRDAYPPPEIPKHLVVVGSGVTGVEFTHLFSSMGSEVSLLVSRQQVLPTKDPEIAAALEEDFLGRGVHLHKGARAQSIESSDDGVVVHLDDGRHIHGTHAILAIGSVPNSAGLGLEEAGVNVDQAGYIVVDHNCVSSTANIYAAGDLAGKLPLASVASMQGRKIAERIMGLHKLEHRNLDYDKAASVVFTEPEIAEVGLAEAEAFALGRKIRVTKVPFSSSAKALINADPRGFMKVVSDPATGVVLGGCVVGRHAAELIGVLALAVMCHLRVVDLADTMFAHPTLSELWSEAAE